MNAQHTPGRLYAKRDAIAQGRHYVAHVFAMTREGLHLKSAIAAELAHRDIVIAELLAALEMVRDADEDCKRDGLPTIPAAARAKIDAAIAKAEGDGA